MPKRFQLRRANILEVGIVVIFIYFGKKVCSACILCLCFLLHSICVPIRARMCMKSLTSDEHFASGR
jgi:hypothetical protein